MAGPQTMGTLSTGHGLRLTTIGRHQCRQGMEPPGSSRKMGGAHGECNRKVDQCRGETRRGCEQELGGTRCEDHLGNYQVWVPGWGVIRNFQPRVSFSGE